MDDREWDRLADQVRRGVCTPFLGAGASSEALPTSDALRRRLAADWDYPFDHEASELSDILQFATVVEGDPVTVKERVVEELARAGRPDFANPVQLHSLLAAHPIPVYLTTNYDHFMSDALARTGKRPMTAVCPWYRDTFPGSADALPRGFEPSPEAPLVYHLHGSMRDPASLVISEQDYLEFLMKLTIDGLDDRRVIPHQVLRALTRQPLLFIGYSLRDWSFKMLFHGLVRRVTEVQRRRHVSVQLSPLPAADGTRLRRAEEYLTRYFEQLNISVYFGTVHDFCAKLAPLLGAAP